MKANGKLIINFFDEFEIMSGDGKERITFDDVMNTKMIQLLQLLILNYRRPLTKKKLIDELYGSDEVENTNGTMNNTIFRLRKYMEKFPCLKDVSVIISDGVITIDTPYELECDVFFFEDAMEKAQRSRETKTALKWYEYAYSIYRGSFLHQIIGTYWVDVRAMHYKSMFFNALREMLKTYKSQEEYAKMLEVSTKASTWFQLEEWQIWRIDSLIAMDRYREAMDVYNAYAEYNMSELGMTPSEDMNSRLALIQDVLKDTVQTWYTVHTESSLDKGGHYCDYSVFAESCDDIFRVSNRIGLVTYVLRCVVDVPKNVDDEEKQKVLDRFGSCLKKSIRSNDFYTNYNNYQYLVLIQGITKENCMIVINRIDYNVSLLGLNGYGVSYSIADIRDFARNRSGDIWRNVKVTN